ncbi:hypothetical protein [Alkalilimnicola sp. S0819]|uniref:hypothetical protein n=1 Tax=Alkalilimnicola sp. S0819 TaxID=2613922 RepID=UPI001262A00C|nr:hypothetical protein [Alkalilimnicola sp. S0819]KAB7619455.1 hypothetical protein F3N43_13735 [Alkalilimnicola sp. S0819]MPQ17698.1 hypothetical protein [Alkalilimnicola sp. S0819]
MGIISRLFGRNSNSLDDKPPIYGGDGLSDQSPAIINCASMGMAHALIDRFIAERCGPGFERGIEFTLGPQDNPDKPLKMICVTAQDGVEHRFYFDLSRPVATAIKMGGL